MRFLTRVALTGALLSAALLAGCKDEKMSKDQAISQITAWDAQISKVEKNMVALAATAEAPIKPGANLPPVENYKIVVAPAPGSASVEIFASPEKAGEGVDGWMREAAEAFNASGATTKTGKPAQVALRNIASGDAYQYIATGRYKPDAFTPSTALWGQMALAQGADLKVVREKTVGNVAGLVLKNAVADKIKAAHGDLSVKGVIDAVARKEMAVGYTDPFSSSTGLNFLVTVLSTFADGDEAKMLSPDVVSTFNAFQRNVPFVALTTMQMRDSVQQDGSLDAFVMEWQTFKNVPELAGSGYTFLPYGQPHNNPLYAVGKLSPEKAETLEKFAAFLEQESLVKAAKAKGFNPDIKSDWAYGDRKGATLLEAQKVWKQNKDGGRPVAAVFIADTSGSMADGERLKAMKRALRAGAETINPANSIGLVEFNSNPSVLVPVRPFGAIQKQSFNGAVQQMAANGGTSMYNAIVVAQKLLIEEVRKNPEIKPVIIVLTDGENTSGLSFDDTKNVFQTMAVPIYTIGFEANIGTLKALSSLVEAASINAVESDVAHKIGTLLNSQM